MPAPQDKVAYASIQAIREGAGLLSKSENERAEGVINGTNKDFTVVRRPIVDTNYDDVAGPEDIHVFVDDQPVDVDSIDAANGSFTLVAAPPTDSKVTVDYAFSPVSDDYVIKKQVESNDWIDLKIRKWIKVPLTDPLPGTVVTAAELYAAGLMLIRDWGSSSDTQLTSKDGFAKIEQARKIIADYIQGLKDDAAASGRKAGSGNVAVATGQEPFGRVYQEDGVVRGDETDDDWFMRRQ